MRVLVWTEVFECVQPCFQGEFFSIGDNIKIMTYGCRMNTHLIHGHLVYTLKSIYGRGLNQIIVLSRSRNLPISPPSGQVGADDHQAGHTEHWK